METVTAILVDDEQDALSILEEKIKSLYPNIQILAKAQNTQEAYVQILSQQPDLVFMDISMPGESGLELLKRMPKHNFELIFVTSLDQHAIDAIRLCAVGFIVKPINNSELAHAINAALEKVYYKFEHNRIQNLLRNLSLPISQDHNIAISMKEGAHFVRVGDIIRCEGWSGYTKVICANGKVLISSQNIGEFRNMLEKYNFYEVHKSHVINVRLIEFVGRNGEEVRLYDGTSIPVSRRVRANLLEVISKRNS
ncbi:MAG: LytTR family DNA-binding domain-containing protein [Saprospiraceae bacterium]|nr:response regulator transcription factor [Candidatus Vicinibacter proximus]MCC6841722.1 response regulator transcription factor [Saprospiraceae bacterium]HRG33178.1 LytTR family DNA-binding domain-containing protein [Saprospiraceae bacterium]